MTAAPTIAGFNPAPWATPMATGAMAAMVPMEVPMAVEMKQQKHAGDQQGDGDEVQSHVDDGVLAAHGGRSALEAAGHQIDQDDHHNAGVAHALAEHIQLLTDLHLGGQQQCHGHTGQQRHMAGDTASYIQSQEDDQGQKRGGSKLFLVFHLVFSSLYTLLLYLDQRLRTACSI